MTITACGTVELTYEEPGGGQVAEVVERERLALDLLDAGEEVGPDPPLRVVGRALMGVLAIRELGHPVEHRDEGLREVVFAAEPASNGGVVRGGRLEGARGKCAPRLDRDLGVHAKLLEHRLVVVRSADRNHVRMVLGCRTEERRAADVDLVDCLFPRDVEPPDRALEGVEVHADEVDRRDSVRLELGDVARLVAPSEDPGVDGRMERHDAVPEQLAEPGDVLDRCHRDPLLRKRARGAAAREELDTQPVELARERADAGLVVHGEQRPMQRHVAISSLTTSGSRRCSTACTRARSVSVVSPGSTATGTARITGPVSMPSSTQWTVAAVSRTPAARTSSIGCAPGNAGSGAEWVFTTRRPNTSKKRGRSRCM